MAVYDMRFEQMHSCSTHWQHLGSGVRRLAPQAKCHSLQPAEADESLAHRDCWSRSTGIKLQQ